MIDVISTIIIMNTLLIGARGSGKTTLGSRLAELSGSHFIDLDDVVLDTFDQATVTAVWESHGESGWRNAEARELGRLLQGSGLIVALGGGTPMIPEARLTIDEKRRTGRVLVVYLAHPAEELAQRLGRHVGDRPSLTGDDPAAEVRGVLEERDPVYRALADVIFEPGDRLPQQAAEALHARLIEAAQQLGPGSMD